jgi:hypothetical protein
MKAICTMTTNEWLMIYEEMKSLFKDDKELTNIIIDFNIQPIKSEQKTARITIKTFNDEKI